MEISPINNGGNIVGGKRLFMLQNLLIEFYYSIVYMSVSQYLQLFVRII